MATATPELSFLDLVNICDNFTIPAATPFDSEQLIPWALSPSPTSPIIGLLRPSIVAQLKSENVRSAAPPSWHIPSSLSTTLQPLAARPRVSFVDSIDSPASRTAVMSELCTRWRDSGLFPDIIGPSKWRAEPYAVYANPFGPHRPPNYAFEMERAATALFGVVTYGVHMTIYESLPSGVHIWVPTRARSKQTFPGMLDNTVAGGIPSGYGVFDSLLKEAMEEASIAEDVVRDHARAAGSVSYFFRTAKGWLQPEIEYVYDLRVPPGADSELFHPKPLDGEVECFELLPLDEVITRMRAGRFKPNCAAVIIDFLIRHGYLTADNEPHFMDLNTRFHGRFDYALW